MKKIPVLGLLLFLSMLLVACEPHEDSGEVQNSPDGSSPMTSPTPTPDTFADVRQTASDCLLSFYSENEIISVKADNKKVEGEVHAVLPSDEGIQPDNWEEICETLENASLALLESTADYSISNAVVYLIGPDDDILLTAYNGTISFDKYTIPESAPVSNAASTTRMVWISANGEHFHSNSSCSQMVNPWQVTRNEAWAMGYTACGRCYS